MSSVPERKIFKISQINAAVRCLLEDNFSHIWVEGEISNLVEPNSGHIYFSLKDEKAQIRAAMFRSKKPAIKFQLKNGMHVYVAAQISLYEPRGDYQLIVDQIEPAGDGILHAKFLQLKAKLEAEGLFATSHKKPLPKIPKYIGVITSPTGAAIRDILNILNRRFSNIPVIIYPTQVQGSEAAEQIAGALQVANERSECDVLILARGGGSLEDLWPFNEENVARAIFTSHIPIISAIGHEIDFTIADFVADIRAPTPSAAAELVVPNIVELIRTLLNLKQRLVGLILQQIQRAGLLLENLRNRLRHPYYFLTQQAQRLDQLEIRLSLVMKHQLTHLQHRLIKISSALDLVSPLATLARGYAIVSKNGCIVRKIGDISVGDKIEAKLVDGSIRCLIEKIT